MSQSSFKEHNLYYQYELVFWEGRYQPIISTWVFLGKQVLSVETAPESTIGYVFALWHHESNNKDIGWHATSVTQTFWSHEMASQQMLLWKDFCNFILSLSREPCRSCCPSDPVGMDKLISLATSAAELSNSEQTSTDNLKGKPALVTNDLYYETSLVLEPRMLICQTCLCEKPMKGDWLDKDGIAHQSWYVSNVFSRNLGIEKFGKPFIHCNPSPSTWNEWCATMSEKWWDHWGEYGT